MVRLRFTEILEKAEQNFEETWLETGKLVGKRFARRKPLIAYVKGKPHPLMEILQKFREAYLRLGFEEILNPVIVEEEDVKKQYGPEALAILDRCYYLAVLPRPDIGIGKDKLKLLQALGIEIDESKVRKLQEVLHAYKKGEVGSDDLVERIAEALAISDVIATRILSEALPEFKELRPEPTLLTLRSHMTTSWFLTLSALQHKKTLPIKLFSVGVRFRREQREDETHLRTHHAASCVVMDEELDVEEGIELAEAVLRQFGFKEFKHVRKKVTAKYYAPETEHETYVKYRGEWVEVANFGLYSPIALAHYKLEYPVLNLGIGVERIAMILYGYDDVRKLVYPQFYEEWSLSDEELASMIRLEEEPSTREGKLLAISITDTLQKYRDASSPCEFQAFKGEAWGMKVEAKVYEYDPGVKLTGPAAFNKVYVYKGNILGLPPTGMDEKPEVMDARKEGVDSGLSYAYAIAAKAAAEAEKKTPTGGEVNIRVKIARTPSDVNIYIEETARRYVQSKGGRIDIRGPVFIGVKINVQP